MMGPLKPGDDKFKAMFGPGHLDQQIRNAISMCWMMLPEDKKTLDDLESQIRRVVDRALRDLREDHEQFGVKPL